MIDFLTDETGDIVIDGGDIVISNARDADRNLIIQTLQTARGGSLIDPEFGVLRNFRGAAPSQMIINRLRSEIFEALVRTNAFSRAQLNVVVVAITPQDLAVMVSVSKSYPGAQNGLEVTFAYNPDYDEITAVTGVNI